VYYAVLPARNLAAALDIQADALRHPALDPGELARELQVIIEEAKRKLDSPAAVAGETLHEVRFDRHRIRRWRIGHAEQLAGFTADDVRGYYASRYVPARVVVALVGDLDPRAMLDAARPCYADWVGIAPAPEAGPEEPPVQGVRARTLRGDVTQAELVVGWRAAPALHPDETPLDLAAAVLGAGRGSWLHRALREPGIAASAGAYSYAPDEVGVFGLAASGDVARLPEMLAPMGEAVARLSAHGPGEEALERARTLLRVRWVRRMESFDARATALAWAVAHGDVTLLDREYARLLAVTPDEVRAAAGAYLAPDTLAAVAYLPREGGDELTPAALTAAFAGRAATPLAATAIAPPPPRAPLPLTGRTEAGTLHVAAPGADLLVHRKRGIPTTTLAVYLPRAWETAGTAGLGALAVRSAIRGAAGLDAGGLALAVERLGGALAPGATADHLSLGVTVLGERTAEAAALVRALLTDAAFAAADVAAERAVLLEEAREVADDMFRYPFQLAFRAAFGDAGYGLPAGGLEESLRAFDAPRVAAYWREVVAAARPVVVAVGDDEPGRLAALLAGAFGDGPSRPARDGAAPAGWQGAGAPMVVPRAKQQSAFAMLFPGPARRDAGHTAAEVWAAVASGLGGRLFEALRERRSLAYTVLGLAWSRRRGGALGAYIATSPGREDEARTEMLRELARFAAEPVGEEELGRAREYLAGQAELSRMTAGAIAGEIAEAWLQGRGLEELEAPWARYRAVTAEEVREVAAPFAAAARAEGVVRGTA
jgi:zinc protease